MRNPTAASYTSLNFAYDYVNRELFGGTLPPCLITLQWHKGSVGYFSGARFSNTTDRGDITDEIALNPAHFAARKPAEVLATFTHEMVHLWQHHFGTPSQKGYHNREWAAKMLAIGLMPTATGKEGGSMAGQHMTHLITGNGRFAHVAAVLLRAHPAILYQDRDEEFQTPARIRKAASKTRYTCPRCQLHAWAKPAAPLLCGTCREPLQADS